MPDGGSARSSTSRRTIRRPRCPSTARAGPRSVTRRAASRGGRAGRWCIDSRDRSGKTRPSAGRRRARASVRCNPPASRAGPTAARGRLAALLTLDHSAMALIDVERAEEVCGRDLFDADDDAQGDQLVERRRGSGLDRLRRTSRSGRPAEPGSSGRGSSASRSTLPRITKSVAARRMPARVRAGTWVAPLATA
jgi:hypothetical protein